MLAFTPAPASSRPWAFASVETAVLVRVKPTITAPASACITALMALPASSVPAAPVPVTSVGVVPAPLLAGSPLSSTPGATTTGKPGSMLLL